MNQEILTAALHFANAKIAVVPVSNDGSKRPALSTWKKYTNELPTVEELMEWFGKTDVEGVGIVTGGVSGIEMLELEGRAVADGMLEQAKELAHNSGLGEVFDAMHNGYCEITPSGGVHWLYRIADEPVPGNTKIARRPGANGGVEVLVETRGTGGFTIVAPSHGKTHFTGLPYKMVNGSVETIAMLSWEERNAIFDIFRVFDSMPQAETIKESATPKTDGHLSPGDDFNARAKWSDILPGWSVVYRQGETVFWRRPGKNIGISATTGRNSGDNLFVFTTSTEFEAEKPYSKFSALTHLQFGGDFRACARWLMSQGYGEQAPMEKTSPLGVLPALQTSPSILQTSPLNHDTVASDELEPAESSWKPTDLTPYFDGTHVMPTTSILYRSDDQALIYPGKVHSFYGESESGKSWLAQIATAEQLRQFRKVTFIDFESDAADVIFRLQLLKVTQAEILQNFTYIRPEASRDHSDPYWQALLAPGANSLVIIDGVTEALTMWGGETKDNDAITRWMRLFPRAIAAASGAAVVMIDHVTKNTETRGRFAIGGQAKLATIDGAAYLVEPLEALAPGRTGSLTIRVTKDRPGYVRRIAGMYRKSDRTQEVAVITMDSTREKIELVIAPPLLESEALAIKTDEFDSRITRFIFENPGTTKSRVVRGVTGTDNKILARLEDLIDEGFVENQGDDRSYILYVTPIAKEKFGLIDANVLQYKANA